MSDGCRLAAKIWLPENAESDPVPALLEYIPYRKSDWTAVGDSTRHAYFAGHGYASVRVDMRGSGDSEGVLLDEYLPQEQEDAVEVLAWLAAQPWCTGATGMFGISWGGFNSLQVAARRPPSLKAIITHCSTDDRYADDVHYMGGCLLSFYMLSWASTMLAINAWPPDPAVVGESWRDLWLERLEGSPPFVEAWLSHQRRDAYWKQGSVCEDYSAIECAVYAVGGWADAYRNAIFRLLGRAAGAEEGARSGPWGHQYPEDGVPGPAIGFLQEALRWWDHWLKGIDTGIMEEPMLRSWMQEWIAPAPFTAEWPGRWVADPSWPSPHVTSRRGLRSRSRWARSRGSAAAGADAGAWCGFGAPGRPARDQRAEDGVSLCHTSEPLDERVEILGFPEVELTLASDRPAALVCVRLCDVAPDGSSLLVTRGLLNLTHRDGHERPEPLVPGERYTVTVRLNSIAHAFAARSPPAGRRLPHVLAVGLALAGPRHPDRRGRPAAPARPRPAARRRPARPVPAAGSGRGDRVRARADARLRPRRRARRCDRALRDQVGPGLPPRDEEAPRERDRDRRTRPRRVLARRRPSPVGRDPLGVDRHDRRATTGGSASRWRPASPPTPIPST